ncbi:MAG: SpoVG family protein, partial [Archaeoglobaceae archaeon]|nr:SpoVG family protein [Archaeoglobaceae archaeon]
YRLSRLFMTQTGGFFYFTYIHHKERRKPMNFEAKIKKTYPETDKVKASVSITIDGSYAVHGIKILETANGLVVAMPNKKIGDKYFDTFHPVNAEARARLVDAIMVAYNEAINQPVVTSNPEQADAEKSKTNKKSKPTENKN